MNKVMGKGDKGAEEGKEEGPKNDDKKEEGGEWSSLCLPTMQRGQALMLLCSVRGKKLLKYS